MTLDLTTPALLFPAISLLFLSYTNRFLALSALIRKLHSDRLKEPESKLSMLFAQISNLRERLRLIRLMQILGATSLLACVVSMSFVLLTINLVAIIFFALGLILMGLSLLALILESSVSGGALNILLDEAEDEASLNN